MPCRQCRPLAGDHRQIAEPKPGSSGRTPASSRVSRALGQPRLPLDARRATPLPAGTGRLQVHLFAALAEFERSLGQERTRAGLEAARARGRTGGRPAVVTSRKLAAALAMRAQGDLTMTQIAEELGVSPASLYRRLARHRQETEVIGTAAT
jgi:hypothetical protein